jgi:hypothetical protein
MLSLERPLDQLPGFPQISVLESLHDIKTQEAIWRSLMTRIKGAESSPLLARVAS